MPQLKLKSIPRGGKRSLAKRDDGPVTLGSVALAAGVSPSTVSRILNGTAIVSELKKKAVEDAIATLGFVPNPIARGLAGGRTFSIGVVTQAIDSPFYGAALRGIELGVRSRRRARSTAPSRATSRTPSSDH